jgi:hypothetical protein
MRGGIFLSFSGLFMTVLFLVLALYALQGPPCVDIAEPHSLCIEIAFYAEVVT